MITYLRNLKGKVSNLHFHVEMVAVIKSGTLQQPEAMGVSQALKEKGYALLCVAKATSDLEVETTYEDEVYDLQFGQYFGRGNTRVAPPWEFEED
jgi:ferredoxin